MFCEILVISMGTNMKNSQIFALQPIKQVCVSFFFVKSEMKPVSDFPRHVMEKRFWSIFLIEIQTFHDD